MNKKKTIVWISILVVLILLIGVGVSSCVSKSRSNGLPTDNGNDVTQQPSATNEIKDKEPVKNETPATEQPNSENGLPDDDDTKNGSGSTEQPTAKPSPAAESPDVTNSGEPNSTPAATDNPHNTEIPAPSDGDPGQGGRPWSEPIDLPDDDT